MEEPVGQAARKVVSCMPCESPSSWKDVIVASLCGFSLTSELPFQVHVGWLPSGTAVLAFRGTATMQDSLQDAKFLRRNIDYLQELYPGTKAHTGKSQARLPWL